MTTDLADIDLVSYIDEAKSDAIFAYNFLKESNTLSASLTFSITHRIPGHDKLLHVRFPQPWVKDKTPSIRISSFSEQTDSVLHETRLDADTLVHAHTNFLSAWSLAHKSFPILYVAAARHILAREIPNHLERTRSARDVITEQLDKHPELAPPPALLESNGGANFWGKGIIRTAQLILLIEEAARYQAIAAPLGGAQQYTPGALELQWARTGLLEKSRAYTG